MEGTIPVMDAALAEALAVTSSRRWDVEERYPVVFARADGAYAWDVDGKRYLDLTSASGAAPLGARHPEVRKAAQHAIDDLGGVLPGTATAYRTAVARQLVDVFPCAERVVFMRTGSCATTAAVRIARAATGKRLVLTSGFHGWHDWHLQFREDAGRRRDSDVVDFGYHLTRLERAVEDSRRAPAAVIVTPEPAYFPEPYYRELERIVRASGALLVYDEVMTGFRYGVGGFHGATRGAPDLVTVSKGLANGTALSAVVGRERHMRAAEDTYLGNTYLRELTPFAVADATVPVLTQHGGIEDMNVRGSCLRDGLTDVFAAHRVEARAIGPGAMFDVVFRDDRWGAELYRRLRDHGVLLDRGKHMISAVTTDAEVQQVLALADRLVGELARTAGLPTGTGGTVPFEALARTAHAAINADGEELEKWM